MTTTCPFSGVLREDPGFEDLLYNHRNAQCSADATHPGLCPIFSQLSPLHLMVQSPTSLDPEKIRQWFERYTYLDAIKWFKHGPTSRLSPYKMLMARKPTWPNELEVHTQVADCLILHTSAVTDTEAERDLVDRAIKRRDRATLAQYLRCHPHGYTFFLRDTLAFDVYWNAHKNGTVVKQSYEALAREISTEIFEPLARSATYAPLHPFMLEYMMDTYVQWQMDELARLERERTRTLARQEEGSGEEEEEEIYDSEASYNNDYESDGSLDWERRDLEFRWVNADRNTGMGAQYRRTIRMMLLYGVRVPREVFWNPYGHNSIKIGVIADCRARTTLSAFAACLLGPRALPRYYQLPVDVLRDKLKPMLM